MGYKSQETLGTVKGKARIDENAIFSDIWKKSQILVEGEDIEAQKAPEKKTDEKLPQAPEAKKHIQGSVEKKAEMEISDKSETETEFDKVDAPQAAEAKKQVTNKKGIKLGESYFKPMNETYMEEMMCGNMEEGMYEEGMYEGMYEGDDEGDDEKKDMGNPFFRTGDEDQLPNPPSEINIDMGSLGEDIYEEDIDEMYSFEEGDSIGEMYDNDEE